MTYITRHPFISPARGVARRDVSDNSGRIVRGMAYIASHPFIALNSFLQRIRGISGCLAGDADDDVEQ